MSEETKNTLVMMLLGGFALATFFIWRKNRKARGNGADVSAGDIYVAGGTPTGSALTIPDPDGHADDSGTSGADAANTFFDFVANSTLG